MQGVSTASDATLTARCRAGDQLAWNELVDRFSPYVYSIIVSGFGLSRPDAEEVFQEVFARTFERLGNLRDDGAIRPWVGQLTRRASIDRLRSTAREVLGEPEEGLAADPEALARIDEALSVHDAMSNLPEQCREILGRFFVRDQSYRSISRALNVPLGTIASRISRCLVKLREELEGRSGAGRPS